MKYFLCDRDVLFIKGFHKTLENSGIREHGLNKLVFFGEKSQKWAVNEHVEYYHHESPRSAALATNHQGLDNLIPFPYAAQTNGQSGSVVQFEWLGGLLNYYHRERESPIEGGEVKSA